MNIINSVNELTLINLKSLIKEGQMKKVVETLIKDFDYEKAVSELREKVVDWSKKTLICARSLYVANHCLSASGTRTDLVPNGTGLPDKQPKTFRQFCEAVGIPKTTAYNWLACYDPEADYLFEAEEVKKFQLEETEALFSDIYKHRQKDKSYIPESFNYKWLKIDKWSDKLEDKYNVWLYEKGYISVNPHIQIPQLPQVDKYGQYGLWTDEYLDSLVVKCREETSGEKAEGFYRTWSKYEQKLPKGVPAQDVMRVSAIAKASLSGLDETQRKETARILAEIIAEIE